MVQLRGPAALTLTVALVLGGCQASGSSAQPSTGATASPAGSDAPMPSASDPGGGLDPDWVTRPALTCGDRERLFPPEALAGPGLAELGLDAATAVLRATIDQAPAETSFPRSGWHRVVDNPDGVTFVARGDAMTPWWEVTVGPLAGTLQATTSGQCNLRIAAPDGVSLAAWWLDPAGPPVTPASTTLAILLRERDCASGKPPDGRVLPPTIVLAPDAVEVVIGIRQPSGAQECPSNPAYSTQLVLPEPLGTRGLYDASQYPPRPVGSDDPG